MKLEDIGFYTLSDKRAENTSSLSQMKRGEMILTDACNFKCPYCRGVRSDCKGNMPPEQAKDIIKVWTDDDLENIRFSGGEPTLYLYLFEVVAYAKERGVKRIAISTNGSAPIQYYKALIKEGVNDFSISLDACCSLDAEKLNGGKGGIWKRTIENIRELSRLTYVTVGIVFTPDNIEKSREIIEFAHDLGVADLRVISSAQYNGAIKNIGNISKKKGKAHPVLKYRIYNFRNGRQMRGLTQEDYNRCPLVLDDSAVAGKWHFPCIIYLREQGNPIGDIWSNMRKQRYEWFLNHNTHQDPICKKNCLDVCIDYNNKVRDFHKQNKI